MPTLGKPHRCVEKIFTVLVFVFRSYFCFFFADLIVTSVDDQGVTLDDEVRTHTNTEEWTLGCIGRCCRVSLDEDTDERHAAFADRTCKHRIQIPSCWPPHNTMCRLLSGGCLPSEVAKKRLTQDLDIDQCTGHACPCKAEGGSPFNKHIAT